MKNTSQIIIRESTDSDIPKIVKVLRASLGDELPISEEIWRYKHLDNPFGLSIVLLAEADGIIVGVRAFMRWKWLLGSEEYTAYRAVDTATLPEYRGNGIFKKLTLAAVEKAKGQGDALVFNTPNDQSRPGYIKMGWERVGKIEVAVKPSFFSLWKIFWNKNQPSVKVMATHDELKDLCDNWNKKLKKRKNFFTPKSVEYLLWRYELNPLQQYSVYADFSIFLAAGIKKRKGIKELRITELILNETSSSSSLARKIIRKWAFDYGVQVITFSPKLPSPVGFALNGKFGPILTVRDLNFYNENRNHIFSMDNFSYSLGDLELF